jgi:hypothetical protein
MPRPARLAMVPGINGKYPIKKNVATRRVISA